MDGQTVDLLGIEDLVRAKKTQRDKDWPMIRRLVEQSYFERSSTPGKEMVEFWLREMLTPELLMEVAAAHPEGAQTVAASRPAVQAALSMQVSGVAAALEGEEQEERRRDREYWTPLKLELEQLRLGRRRDG